MKRNVRRYNKMGLSNKITKKVDGKRTVRCYRIRNSS